MNTLNWTSNNSHAGVKPYVGSTRFASWVTFDDDADEVPGFKTAANSSNIKLDNLNTPQLQDANSNLLPSSIGTQRTDRHILDLTPDRPDSVFTFDSPSLNSAPYTKKNPFLDGDVNIQPSPINPFSAYFKSTSTDSEDPLAQNTDSQTGSILLFSTSGHAAGTNDPSPSRPSADQLAQFKSLQIPDPDATEGTILPDDAEETEGDGVTLYEPAHMVPKEGWPMLLRIPEKKNIMSSRHWGPIFVRLTDSDLLQLFYEKGLDKPFKEFQLNARLELSEHRLQNYEENSRVHTLSLDHVTYKEKRKIQPKVSVVHIPVKEQMVKLGTHDYQDFLSFKHALQEKLVGLLPDPESISSPYSEEEIQVEVVDVFHGVLSKGDGCIMQQLVTTRISVLAFLNGSPSCRLGLNDVQVKGKEVVSRQDIIPNTTTRWIRLKDVRLHDAVDHFKFEESRGIEFSSHSGQRFELLSFRTVYAEKTLPFTLRTVFSVRGAEVELQSWLVMSTGFSSNIDPLTQIPCENVAIRYPIPCIWAKNFRRESVTGEKSIKARFNKGASFGSASSSGSEPAMRVTLGTAKYEQAFKSVVWRISRLPDKNSALGHPHTFFCRLELGSDWEVPQTFQCLVEVEFDMPAASASKTTVRSLSVEDRTELKKWITYKAHYSYQVEMEQKSEGVMENMTQGQERPGDCTQQ